MNIAIGCDHGAYELKNTLVAYLTAKGHTVKDFGCFSTDSVDYSDYAFPVAEAVAAGTFERGIVLCTTGIGVSVCANKVKGVRCALCTSAFQAEMTRRHNDTNVLALGAKTVSRETAEEITELWLSTAFEGGRHARRIGKIAEYESNH